MAEGGPVRTCGVVSCSAPRVPGSTFCPNHGPTAARRATVSSAPGKSSGLLWCIGIGVGLLLLGALFGDKSDRTSSAGGATITTAGSAANTAACVHWHNVMGDVQQGILSDPEIREKVKQVRDSASDQRVLNASTALLAAL